MYMNLPLARFRRHNLLYLIHYGELRLENTVYSYITVQYKIHHMIQLFLACSGDSCTVAQKAKEKANSLRPNAARTETQARKTAITQS